MNKFPLKDGDLFVPSNGQPQRIMGEIKAPHAEPVAWTLQGNWYRRKDGVQMTQHGNEVVTVKEAFERRRKERT